MNHEEVLKQWGIFIPDDTYSFEYLLKNRRNNCFFVDKIPIAVKRENAYKFDQIDLLYQDVLEGVTLKEDFEQIEQKYISFTTKCWLYNRTSVYFDIDDIDLKKCKNILTSPNYVRLTEQIRERECVELTDKNDLDLWIQMGMRDLTSAIIVFKEFQLMLTASWSCFIAYLNDMKNYSLIKDIAVSEGLFIRKAKCGMH